MRFQVRAAPDRLRHGRHPINSSCYPVRVLEAIDDRDVENEGA
jgi:hypothetical protein